MAYTVRSHGQISIDCKAVDYEDVFSKADESNNNIWQTWILYSNKKILFAYEAYACVICFNDVPPR